MLKNLGKFSLPEIEEKVLKFWKENKVFEKSVALRSSFAKATADKQAQGKKHKKFVFFEGPPTANGRPGIHHVLVRAFKDIICRYKTMAGFFVPRRGGWDTHGLPVELEVEKQLGLKSKKDIEKYGIAEFNQKCKESVWKYKDEWEKLTERIGFWLDLKNPYITYENYYIESLWWIISQVAKRKLLYKGHKVVPWCTRCGTALSSHEMAQGYKEAEDQSVYAKFRLKKGQRIGNLQLTTHNSQLITNNWYILSWTTTPWTLPGNVALAVGPNIDYAIVSNGKENYVLAESRKQILAGEWKILGIVKGKQLVGLCYEPLFKIKPLENKNAFKVYPANFVTTEEGTGVVHTAVMYGEEDYELGTKIGLPKHHTVNEQGKFTKDVPGLAGLYVKDKKTEEKIINYLKSKNLNLKTEIYNHDYPFCWRCDTPLLYYARESWFIAMSKLRRRLLEENEKANWIPDYLKHGRFGEWLKEAKDWAFSRERYWGTPLPVWECNTCGHREYIESRRELAGRLGHAHNRYLLLRHGEALHNLHDISSSTRKGSEQYPLTLRGRAQIEKIVHILKREKIDFVVASDFRRTQETARLLKQFLGVQVIFDKRLREVQTGEFDAQKTGAYRAYFTNEFEKFVKPPPNGETLREVANRVNNLIAELEKQYQKKKILLVSHEYTLWMYEAVLRGLSEEEAALTRAERVEQGRDFIEVGELREVSYIPGPRNKHGFGDLHRPYVDEIRFPCTKCNKKMRRVEEVVDVWFDSGAMPLAKENYPFSFARNPKSEIRNPKQYVDYPADYICEAVDQTRGWFYTLLAVAVLLDQERPYKNVISVGHVLDKRGEKMSKSKGNIVDPWQMIKKYGADVVRWHFFTVNPPGEPKRFDEQDLAKVSRQFFSLVYNSFVFFHTYATKNSKLKTQNSKLTNVLDRWVIARLHETISKVTQNLDKYEVVEAARALEEFTGDLSRWYIRRSRRRFQKPESQKDYIAASQTLSYVLFELSKLLAPFVPFFAESLFQSLEVRPPMRRSDFLKLKSVHLEDWPKADLKLIDKKLLAAMAEVRRLASLVLAKRAEAGIKVRQPLAQLKVKSEKLKVKNELLQLLKEEVNVKGIVFDKDLKNEIELDTTITHELKEEGWLREFVRIVQDLRQDAKLKPKDKATLALEGGEELHELIQKNEAFVKREVNVKTIEYQRHKKFDIELETKLDEWPIWLSLRKPK